jgi:catechol 2,3-dioxygenase-like lactoylglutathione lyase family enzyme
MIEYQKNNQVYFILNVTDLQIAKDFFEDIFDFKVLFDYKTAGLDEEMGWMELSLPCQGARLGLNLIREGQVIQGSGQLCFYVKDVNATREFIEQNGITTDDVTDDIAAMDIARSEYGYDALKISDPFGNEIMFIGNDPTKFARRSDETIG